MYKNIFIKRKQAYEAPVPGEDDLFPAPWLAESELMCVQLILTHAVVSSYGIAARNLIPGWSILAILGKPQKVIF